MSARTEGERGLAGRLQGQFELFCKAKNERLALAQEEIPLDVLAEQEGGTQETVLKRLLAWFKRSYMKPFVSTLPCGTCGGNDTVGCGTVPPTAEERQGLATVVELHQCNTCFARTRFPRYNDMKYVMRTRQGRCGEWAMLFTLFCQAAGMDARIVLDFTDHLWTEVFIEAHDRWVMCDPCEGTLDTPLMYEVGWGKKLSYVFALHQNYIIDVTRRYTAHYDDEVRGRRTLVQDSWLAAGLARVAATLTTPLGEAARDQLIQALDKEMIQLQSARGRPLQEEELRGRQTGAEQWRRERGELGKTPGNVVVKRQEQDGLDVPKAIVTLTYLCSLARSHEEGNKVLRRVHRLFVDLAATKQVPKGPLDSELFLQLLDLARHKHHQVSILSVLQDALKRGAPNKELFERLFQLLESSLPHTQERSLVLLLLRCLCAVSHHHQESKSLPWQVHIHVLAFDASENQQLHAAMQDLFHSLLPSLGSAFLSDHGISYTHQ